jgi:plastocyanin
MRAVRLALLLGCALLQASPAGAAEVAVNIDNFTFTPAEIEVAAGTNVVWTNRDDIPHTVTDAAAPRATHSPPLDTGDTYARTFDAPGTYHYFCSLHPHMQGTVVVR